MSDKSSILLTKDNEHWYRDFSDDTIVLEFDKDNITIFESDCELVVTIKKDTELFKKIMELNNGKHTS